MGALKFAKCADEEVTIVVVADDELVALIVLLDFFESYITTKFAANFLIKGLFMRIEVKLADIVAVIVLLADC